MLFLLSLLWKDLATTEDFIPHRGKIISPCFIKSIDKGCRCCVCPRKRMLFYHWKTISSTNELIPYQLSLADNKRQLLLPARQSINTAIHNCFHRVSIVDIWLCYLEISVLGIDSSFFGFCCFVFDRSMSFFFYRSLFLVFYAAIHEKQRLSAFLHN